MHASARVSKRCRPGGSTPTVASWFPAFPRIVSPRKQANSSRRFWLLALCAVLPGLAGCAAVESSPPGELSAQLRDSAGVRVLLLSRSLYDVTRGKTAAIDIFPDLRLGDSTTWFGAVADVHSMGGGRFAVLDRLEKNVQVFDSLGRRAATFGRPGKGPGEFIEPWALTVVNGKIVVRQNAPTSTFTVIEPDGEIMATGSAIPDGDWDRPMFRHPHLDMLGFQMGPEDVSRRLAPFGDSGFIHMLAVNEFEDPDWAAPVEFAAIPEYLIRYGLDATVRDTLAVAPGPPTKLERVVMGATMFYTQPLFSGRPVWTTGDGWYALGHGDSAKVVVHDMAGDTILLVRWPNERHPVSAADRRDAGKWYLAPLVLRAYSAATRREVEKSPRILKKELELQLRENIAFADSTPHVTAAYGAGNCLFLGGYEPRDWQDGTALTWVALNVRRGTLAGVLRATTTPDASTLPYRGYAQQGAAIRSFDEHFVFTSFRNGDGVSFVERFPLPELECGD